MHYASIKPCDIANGPGVRVSLFVSGCTHHCPGCFNKETWDFSYGQPFTEETMADLYEKLSPGYITGLTLLGGEPLEPVNQQALLPFVEEVRRRFPDKTIWCYTGYTYETDLLAADGRAHCTATDRLLGMTDVLVDGRFVQDLRDITLLFRGSSNQRLIDLARTRETGSVVLWENRN
ncbi:MAG: anaerobic ribonucleoside-triphosphate reductase activating protein [Clostridia bacterium]|nr:anaerobic ribonucleoside-triphosphate reductase activating protein [Clostridia bacterium]MBQ4607376.1 anaerobic ribonucleoside-triphosphate reductase activating protein [Clostridia bacterium]